MSSRNIRARIFAAIAVAALFILSLRGPGAQNGELSMLMEPDGTGIWHSLIDGFQAQNPNVRVRLVEGPPATNAREDMYSTSFLSGDAAYDIVYCDVVWIPKFAAAGWLLDVTERLSPADHEDFLSADLNAGFYKGRLYRIPAYTDAGVLYYRKDLVPHPPETFDELEADARKLTSANRSGFLWQGKQYEGLITVFLEVLWGFGGDWIDADSREVLLDRPEALQALTFLTRTVGTIAPPATTTYIEEDTRLLFQGGRAVFMRNWPYVWTLMAETPMRSQDKVAMVPVVHIPGHVSAATLGGWGFAISKFTKNAEAAWRFVEFLTRPEQLRKVQIRMGRIPARKSLVPSDFAQIVNTARMRPPIPEYAQASDILQRWLSAALTRRVLPEEALKEAARETRLLLGDNAS